MAERCRRLSRLYQLHGRQHRPRASRARQRPARQQHDHRALERPWLATRREETVAQVHAVGTVGPGRPDHGRLRRTGPGPQERPDGRVAGSVPDACRSERPAPPTRTGRPEPAPAPDESRCRMGQACDHEPGPRQGLRAHRALAIQPLPRWRGIVRPRQRSNGMDQSGRPAGACRDPALSRGSAAQESLAEADSELQ